VRGDCGGIMAGGTKEVGRPGTGDRSEIQIELELENYVATT
jgi:hypothetical protein